MNDCSNLQGLWLPLITPFLDGQVDEASLRILIRYYSQKGFCGIILAATTGEGQTLSDDETKSIVDICRDEISKENSNLNLYLGLSGTDPVRVSVRISQFNAWPIDGYLISGPNYVRPTQAGVYDYFAVSAKSTKKPVIIYNIPYRTGVNIENETMVELASIPNVVGVKDCCSNPEQSYDLIRRAPDGFSVFTGEDGFFYNAFVHGAPGAIVTGSHVLVDYHLSIFENLANGNQPAALELWNKVVHIPALLFAEPSPAPLKYWLWRQGLISSPEVRSPMMPIRDQLEKRIDMALAQQ